MSKDECCSGSFKSFLTGALFGTVIGLLIAPRTGRETREALAEYGAMIKENLPDELKEKTDETIERGREYIDEKKRALNEAIEAGRIAMEEEKESLNSALKDSEG